MGEAVNRAALLIRMNDVVVAGGGVIPLVHRARVRGVANRLAVVQSVWDLDFAFLHDWYREA